jgi:hypothetical protein
MRAELSHDPASPNYIRFDDRDMYSLEQMLAKVNHAALVKLLETVEDERGGVPDDFCYGEDRVSVWQYAFDFYNEPAVMHERYLAGRDLWKEAIGEMIFGFEFMTKQKPVFASCTQQEYAIHRERANRGLALYAKYFDYLYC